MNKLPSETRARILHLLCEGNSIRATVRLTGASKNTIAKLLVTAGQACMDYQDRVLVNLNCKRIEVDELWSFVGSKEKNVPADKKGMGEMGDVWTWVAICAESKLVPAWYIGDRDSEAAMFFMDKLAKRLAHRVQLTSDGHAPYLEAVEGAFGADIDFAPCWSRFTANPAKRKAVQPRCNASDRSRRRLKESPSKSWFQRLTLNGTTA